MRLIDEMRQMTSKSLSTIQPTNNPRRGLCFNILLVLCLFASGCTTTAVLTDAALNSCGTNTVYLNSWQTNISDKSTIVDDPMGGYQLVYWVDNAGNACHGDPGVNGQTGPALIHAYRPQLDILAAKGSSITEEQLKTFQEIPVSFDNYAGYGLHFVQFYNTFMRVRADGTILNTWRHGAVASIPIVTEIGNKACIAPVAFRAALEVPIPIATSQDPNECRVRAMPSGATMSEADRKKYDALNLPHGTEYFNVP